MPKSLIRYISFNALVPFLLIFIFLIGFLMTFQLIKITNLLASQNVSYDKVLELFLQIAVTFVPLASPIAILFSSIFCINKLSQESEYIAMRSFGLSNLQIYFPVLIVSIVISFWVYTMGQNVIPIADMQFKRTVHEIKSKSFLAELKSGRFFYEIPNLILFAKEIEKETFTMKDVFVRLTKAQKGVIQEKIISAHEGRITFLQDDENISDEISVEFKNGNIINYKPNDLEDVEKIIFDVYNFNILEDKDSYNVFNKASGMPEKELKKFLNLSPKELAKRHADQGDLLKAKIELYSRINNPIICLVFSLIGFCLGISHQRSQSRSIAKISIIVLISYFSLYFGGIGMAKKEQISVFLAIFSPTILFAIFAIIMFKRSKWLA
ncbi:MAG: LptF/LptG family permease [Halobacteriovoraceae bacterium]|nr:LptF/LptG family permease [Halobacteriovoraceae bacterium]